MLDAETIRGHDGANRLTARGFAVLLGISLRPSLRLIASHGRTCEND